MPRSPSALVFDSWPLLAYFEDEPPSAKVEELIGIAIESGSTLWMNVVNAGEVWYTMARNFSTDEADQSILELGQLGIQIVAVDWNLTRLAAAFKTQGKISYADCFALALAKQKKAELVTGDHEFKAFEREVKISWL